MKHWVIEWSNRQTTKKQHSSCHDVKYVNEHGEHQFIFNQELAPILKAKTR